MACYPGQPMESEPVELPSDSEQDFEEAANLKPHSTQTTVTWLEDNYHYEDGICLPRSTIYEHYMDFCQRDQLHPVNAASFGKIIRQQFPQLTTRRLGTRGQSKYHYYGLGIKPTSRYYTDDYVQKQQNQGASRKEPDSRKTHAYYASKEKPSAVLPPFPDVKTLSLADNIPRDKLHTFMVMYRAHCQRILDSIVRANFAEVENFLLHFWQGMPTHLLPVLASEVVVDLVALCDYSLYKVTTNVLIQSPLQNFPESLAQEVLKFSAMLRPWLDTALKGLPNSLRETKYKVADSFMKSIRRQTSLMQLAQAARTALRSDDSLIQLRKDWGALDLPAVFAHTLYAIQPMDIPREIIRMVPDMIQEFAGIMQQDKCSVEDFVLWVEQLLERCINMGVEGNSEAVKQIGRTFLLSWKFFTSKIVREFTLQSAPSFGTFHLLHMLVDDYIIHWLESSITKEEEKAYSKRIELLKLVSSPETEERVEDIQVEDQYQEEPALPSQPTDDFSLHNPQPTPIHIIQQPSVLCEERPPLATAHTFDNGPIAQMTQPEVNLNSTTSSLPPVSSLTLPSVEARLQTTTLASNFPISAAAASTTAESVQIQHIPNTLASSISGLTGAALSSISSLGLPRVTDLRPPSRTTMTQAQPTLGDTVTTFPGMHGHMHLQVQLPSITAPLQPLHIGITGQNLSANPLHDIHNAMNPPHTVSIPMPLTHPAQMAPHAGIPLLHNMYPYSPYGGLPMHSLPSQPISSSMVRMSAPTFPTQALVSGYPSYVPPSLYGNVPVTTGNFTR